MMMVMTLVLFFFLIPILREREGIRGVRFGLFLFLIISLLMTIPPLYKGYYNFLFIMLIYIANFILATFMNCPDVIGISGDAENWFKHKIQLMILLIYTSIVTFYIMGFAFMLYEISMDPAHPNAFSYNENITPSYPAFLFYSVANFVTVGYGEINPLSNAARLVVSIESMIGMIINVVFIAILLVFVSTYSRLEEKMEEKKLRKEEEKIKKEEQHIEREEEKIEQVERRIEDNIQQNPPQQFDSVSYMNPDRIRKYPNYLDGRNNKNG